MRANKYGRIILLTSVVFQNPVMGTLAYSASKAGLVGLVRTVALENARMKITCNCISLGYFDAGMLYQIPEQLREQIRMKIPLERFGRIEELAKTIDYLVDTEYITGQVISLNGGLYFG
jgi:NAD(P)-dependent dehydrogenase (short-subunit alcohol dehydrogenase family)